MSTSQDLANAIRFLSADAIEKAQSGHPGAPLGMAEMAEALWRGFLKHNPGNPHWWDRDRFILSNGHASMLLYSLLHLTGYDVSIEDIQNFRQLGSKTPGHPEFGATPGVEVTTGPLGQGIAMGVGMALAERLLAEEFNRPNHSIIDHHTYVFMGDGCLMEGVSHEACSLAGTLGLGKLVALWDDNGISIDGSVSGWFTENVPMRFTAYGWHVITDVDGHDPKAIRDAIAAAKAETSKPSLICCKTTIGKGAPTKSNSAGCHGSPLGAAEIAAMRKDLNWPFPAFTIPQPVKEAWDAKANGARAEASWQQAYSSYKQAFPELAASFEARMNGILESGWQNILLEHMQTAQHNGKATASRVASKNVLDALAPKVSALLGGSADLTGSVGTRWKGSEYISKESFSGRYIAYGVREFGMGAIMNGLARHGGFIPYGGTFLVFADYAKNAIRLSALMRQQVVWVLTHDSIMMGEDGPTHQPVEQLGMLRMTPNVFVWRPCDEVETAAAWQFALSHTTGPTCLALSRQNLPVAPRSAEILPRISKGAYILRDCQGQPEILLLATGSEVALALEAAETLTQAGKKVRVISMPCPELFDQQDTAYKEAVLPSSVRRRIAIEAAATAYWHKYVGLDGKVIGMHSFGDSAPGPVLYEHFGFSVQAVTQAALTLFD